ncbi:MAG: hypothetical protein L0H53_03335 [Candidatus Nitrosocosmicus sp.]|nr:hypothetical protein [Candidatus Nitrosocosmicus sp.]
MVRKKGDKDFTDSEKNMLISLINDYEVCGYFTDLEMIKMLSQKLGKNVGNTTFYRLKKEALKNKLNSEQWLDKFVRFELFDFYRKRIEEVKLVQKELIRLFAQEASKNENEKDSNVQNKQLMNQLAKTINDNSKILSEMGMGPPFLAKLQLMIPKELLEGDLEYTEKHFEKMDKNKKILWSVSSDEGKGVNNTENEEVNLDPSKAPTALLPPIDNLDDNKPTKKGSNSEEANDQDPQRVF